MKIAVCTPCHSDPSYRYAQSLGALLLHPTKHDLKLFLHRLSPVSLNRNIIAESALEWGAAALLWIDADQTFPEDTLERLLAHRRVLVGCNIATRAIAPEFTATKNGPKVQTTAELAGAKALEEVDLLGFGICLTAAQVFAKLDRPWFAETPTPRGGIVGEDCYFMERARKAGFKVYVDHALSWQVGHVYERVLFPVDALAS